jgi:hypothetical protein
VEPGAGISGKSWSLCASQTCVCARTKTACDAVDGCRERSEKIQNRRRPFVVFRRTGTVSLLPALGASNRVSVYPTAQVVGERRKDNAWPCCSRWSGSVCFLSPPLLSTTSSLEILAKMPLPASTIPPTRWERCSTRQLRRTSWPH